MLTTVTSLISRGGQEAAIAGDIERAFFEAGQEAHHVGTLLIQQGDGLSFLVSQFAGEEDLRRWRASPAHRRMVAALERDSLRELCVIGEPIVRMTVPSDGSGPKWKVLASTWVLTYPLLLALSALLDRVAPTLPWAIRLALTSGAVSVALIWAISPLTRRLTRVWRLRDQQMRVDVVRYPPPPEGALGGG
ncbi:hypothetical protein EAH89_05255 [Roseomonas nepalensis]|uniref:Antibiotic biosynthesis monooxygenase n=1 Tax=Muricoccus nepalensis TaxID=1854500 RepID=A0A502GDR0_9PROT|nr:hypothetical protein [Roseomonas nepalensis]TPG59648.1 hypothetical protein EAH89_05255 [Roseomonas nepalensis]